jgi:hypothetical protein
VMGILAYAIGGHRHGSAATTTYTMHVQIEALGWGGAQDIQVRAPDGTLVGTATAEMGGGCLMNGCSADVDVPGLPMESFYQIILGNNAFPLTTTASFADLDANGWTITIRPH